MKKITLMVLAVAAMALTKPVMAQTAKPFTGAEATLKHYNALYIINTADEKRITGTLRNINNALQDPRLQGKLTVEVIAFGDGVSVYRKSGTFKEKLEQLQAKGVLLAQCENTIRERQIPKDSLYNFINYVPSGNGEIIIRQYQGWATVHP